MHFGGVSATADIFIYSQEQKNTDLFGESVFFVYLCIAKGDENGLYRLWHMYQQNKETKMDDYPADNFNS